MNLFYKELGQTNSPKLIILHGLLGSSDNWLTISKQLAEKYHVFLIDQRNHGQSPHAEEWNYEVMVQDLWDFFEKTFNFNQKINENTYEKVNLLGHSMGGKTAMFFAGKYPYLIEKLIIVDISPRYYPPHHQLILDTMQSLDLNNISSRKDAELHFENAGLDVGTRQFILKNLYRTPENIWVWRVNLPVIAQKIENVGEALPNDMIYLGKTLFIKGENSNYIQENDDSLIKSHFPNAQIDVILQAGHWVHAEKPQETFLVIMNYEL